MLAGRLRGAASGFGCLDGASANRFDQQEHHETGKTKYADNESLIKQGDEGRRFVRKCEQAQLRDEIGDRHREHERQHTATV